MSSDLEQKILEHWEQSKQLCDELRAERAELVARVTEIDNLIRQLGGAPAKPEPSPREQKRTAPVLSGIQEEVVTVLRSAGCALRLREIAERLPQRNYTHLAHVLGRLCQNPPEGWYFRKTPSGKVYGCRSI